MRAPLVKICGLTSAPDAAAAQAAGADYVGVVLVPGTRRSRTVAEALGVFSAAGSAGRVGVFANAAPDDVLAAAAALRLAAVQLHGSEPPAALAELRARGAPPLWKAVPAGGTAAAALALVEAYAAVADVILLDGVEGGGGQAFAWASFREVRTRLPARVRLAVAGGLAPGNVGSAIAVLAPDVVDVSSGVEAVPGRKSPELMRAFVAASRAARE